MCLSTITLERRGSCADNLTSSVTAAKQEGISKYLDGVFDSAYNQTQIIGDLPNVKWGRIDYLNVTYITTKWGIWQYAYTHSISAMRGR